ncbi:MAG: AAA family ATPase [Methylobacter sp.]|jgi:predicted ATPase|nr:AAA family ATPase [Methylobacter sp.]
MIRKLQINNYKSLHELTLDVGRFNVFIGENGCGKSNLLEAIALVAAAAADKLDHEFLASRGIRVTEPELMRSAFSNESQQKSITIDVKFEGFEESQKYTLYNDNQPYAKWTREASIDTDTIQFQVDESFIKMVSEIIGLLRSQRTIFRHIELLALSGNKVLVILVTSQQDVANYIIPLTRVFAQYELQKAANYLNAFFADKDLESLGDNLNQEYQTTNEEKFKKYLKFYDDINKLSEFIIFSPENTALRNFYKEGQIKPLGINGEGLLKLLKVIQNKSPEQRQDIQASLQLFDWYAELEIPKDLSPSEDKVTITDRYLTLAFDQRSANEGFLFVLFYIALMVSDDTPKIFAIDNIDTSLNPKLCTKLIKELVRLAKKYDKQVFVTTHNPAILDGIDLSDDEQRLLVVSRNKQGHTRYKRITLEDKPRSSTNEDLKLSEAFLRGYLGGLPKGF